MFLLHIMTAAKMELEMNQIINLAECHSCITTGPGWQHSEKIINTHSQGKSHSNYRNDWIEIKHKSSFRIAFGLWGFLCRFKLVCFNVSTAAGWWPLKDVLHLQSLGSCWMLQACKLSWGKSVGFPWLRLCHRRALYSLPEGGDKHFPGYIPLKQGCQTYFGS